MCYFQTHSFEKLLLDALRQSILELCDCDVFVIPKRFQCVEEHTAYFDVTVEGFMAGNVKELLEKDKLTSKLDLEIATLYVCSDSSCLHTTDNMTSVVAITPRSRGDDGKSSDSQNIPIIVIIFCLSVLVIVEICLVVAFVLSRY